MTKQAHTRPPLPLPPGALVLAPMVRTGELPFRLEALGHGADFVWGPEIIDKALVAGGLAVRKVNPATRVVEFVKEGPQGTGYPIARIHPDERARHVFQLGSAVPELAVAAASLVAPDVAAVELNCGCPKHFSTHAGMGAALLKNPDQLCRILHALVDRVGRPMQIPILCKIRILPDADATLELVRRLCTTGISALTIHCRTSNMRAEDAARPDRLAGLAAECRAQGVVCIANGGISGRAAAQELLRETGFDAAMLAQAAQRNPSVFRREGPLSFHEAACSLLRRCIAVANRPSNTKFMLMSMTAGLPKRERPPPEFARAKTHPEMCAALGIAYEPPPDTESIAVPAHRDKHVFVTVGSTSFDALVAHVLSVEFGERLVEHGFSTLRVQYGGGRSVYRDLHTSSIPGLAVSGFAYAPSLDEEMAAADLVISHAGAGSILGAKRAGKAAIVVANEGLMDNHQLELANKLAEEGYVCKSSVSGLAAALDTVAERLRPLEAPHGEDFARLVEEQVDLSRITRRTKRVRGMGERGHWEDGGDGGEMGETQRGAAHEEMKKARVA